MSWSAGMRGNDKAAPTKDSRLKPLPRHCRGLFYLNYQCDIRLHSDISHKKHGKKYRKNEEITPLLHSSSFARFANIASTTGRCAPEI
jgi:hypothetical protein